jgi:hypothetical protein
MPHTILSEISQIPRLSGYSIIFATTAMILPGLSLLFGQLNTRGETKPVFYHHRS